MAKVLKGWKMLTVKASTNQLVSWSIAGNAERAYEVGFWTFPARHCGPLGVWASKKALDRFLVSDQSPKTSDVIAPCLYVPAKDQSAMWNDKGDYLSRSAMPRGTVLAEQVQLITE